MKRIDQEILHIAVPSIVSNVTVPLLGLVDVTIVGHMGSAAYIGAIAVGSMIFNVIYWVFGFLRMGTSGMTSQAYGARDWQGLSRLLVRALTVGIGVGMLFIVLQSFIRHGALALMPHPTFASTQPPISTCACGVHQPCSGYTDSQDGLLACKTPDCP